MECILCSILFYVALFVGSVFSCLYLYFKWQYTYWKRLNVEYLPPSFPFGNFGGAGFSYPVAEMTKRLYDSAKGMRVVGFFIFYRPYLLLRDPELVKTVFVKDFHIFQDRGIFVNERDDPLNDNLFFRNGKRWRNLRTKLTPVFTSGKLKLMFPILTDCCEVLKVVLAEEAERDSKGVVEMKEICARFTTDIISSCAFGIETNSMRNPDAIFRVMGKKVLQPSFKRVLTGVCMALLPPLTRALRMVMTPKDVTEFFTTAVQETITYREENNIKRDDFMQLLIELKNQGRLPNVDSQSDATDDSNKFTATTAAAQAFVFFLAGFETSSTTMQFALYELSVNPEIQDQAREEVVRVLGKYDGKVTYEGINEMHYLGRVIDETLRKYPVVPSLKRICGEDYPVPGTEIVLRKGAGVQISMIGLHHDPEYFPNPEKFDPDRFTEEEKSKRPNGSYVPFGDGPRNCIGMRFGLIQTKVGLVTLLKNFRFEVSEKTLVPAELDIGAFFLSPKGGMHLKVIKINEK